MKPRITLELDAAELNRLLYWAILNQREVAANGDLLSMESQELEAKLQKASDQLKGASRFSFIPESAATR